MLPEIPHLNMQAVADAGLEPSAIHSVEAVGSSSRVPALLNILQEFFGKEPGRTLNSKEVVSRGCALNCAMLSPIFRYQVCTRVQVQFLKCQSACVATGADSCYVHACIS